jgi:hypothetical protein
VLKKLERSGIVKLRRGSVEIVDGRRLRSMRAGAGAGLDG